MRPSGRWAATFSRFQPGNIPLAGPLIVRVADWSQPRAGRAPMFDHPLLERLSMAHPAFIFGVYAPAGMWLLWRAISAGMPIGTAAWSYLAGLFVWSLLEYVAHRGSFHHVPTTPGQVAYGYLVHGV